MHRQAKGFTLIELMLAMTFIAILLIAITMLTIQVSNLYTRGITLKQINEAGTEISNDFQRSIRSGQTFSLDGSGNYREEDGGGRLCLGTYSYAWNTSGETPMNKYAESNTPIRLVKVLDRSKALCQSSEAGEYTPITFGDDTVELLSRGDRDLAVHKLKVQASSEAPGVYTVSLTIGTRDTALLEDGRDQCRPPVDLEGQEDYCAVNTFEIVARTGSQGVSGE